jgi:hypothetical protein
MIQISNSSCGHALPARDGAAGTGILLLSLLIVLFATPRAAMCQSTTDAYATAQIEHDSNIFRVPNSAAAAQLSGDPTLADTDMRYIVGLTGDYLWSLQRLTANLEARRIDYNHFSFLDHFEYLGNIQYDWKASSALDGLLQFREERLAAPFADRQSLTTLELNTDRNLVAKLNYNVNPLWRLDTGVNYHTLETPIPLFPDYTEHEVGTRIGLSYLGVANLTYGIGVDHINGDFSNAVGVAPYTQTTALLKANYIISGLSSLNGSVGYTKRDQNENGGNISTATGDLAYSRQLTGKTSLVVQLSRAVNSYVIGGGSEVDTTGSAALTWRATYKISVTATGGYTRSTFEGEGIPGTVIQGRLDHSPFGSVNLAYQVLRRLQIKGYFSTEHRDSNVELFHYNDTIVGIQLTGHWREQPLLR